jgi:hypothetical protein
MAWWLAYEELYGNMDEEYPIMSESLGEDVYENLLPEDWKDRVGAADTVSIDFNGEDDFGGTLNLGYMAGSAGSDTINFGVGYGITGTHLPGGMGEDHISFTKPQPNLDTPVHKKYQEDLSMKDLSDYVSSTYSGHYTNGSSNVQTLDLIHSVGDAESFCRSNAIKYLSRYDKKGQAKRDILKAMHYCLLLYYFSGNTNDEITTRGYETF